MGGGDESAVVIGTGKNDVARLIAHQERANHARGLESGDVDDTDAVGEVIDHPYFGGRTESYSDGFESDRDGCDEREGLGGLAGDGKNFETVGGRVGGEEQRAVGGKGERANFSAFEECVRGLGRGGRAGLVYDFR